MRHQIDTVAIDLIESADRIRLVEPTLAKLYRAIGQGLDSSHRRFQGNYSLTFEIPEGCTVTLSKNKSFHHTSTGPVQLFISVPRERPNE